FAVGDKDTATFTIAGNVLTISSGGVTSILRKGVPTPAYFTGTWILESIGGTAIPSNSHIELVITRSTLRMIETGSTPCSIDFTYTRDDNDDFVFVVTGDNCGQLEPGEEMTGSASYSTTNLELVMNDVLFRARR
ncbi:MAG: hypothetical protein H7X80_11695, partial [bacterium]|nr:hypothetical protein [Candidatus Kapabacteria bacterium]